MSLAETIAEPMEIPAEAETGGTLIIDLDAVEANWRALGGFLVSAECAAVVKADAYGLGLEPVTTKLSDAGCKTFFVADLAEARRARACAPDATIYVLNGFSTEGGPAFTALNARPVINSMTELAEWDAFVAAHNWSGGAALQVDTGMNRLGVSPGEAAALAPRVQKENHGITLLMSHYACAEVADHPFNEKQLRIFQDLSKLYYGVPASLANSAGIFLSYGTHFDMARPGAALYGINPMPGRYSPVRHVLELTGRVLQVRNVDQGATVGYGAAWTAKRASRIGVVALGYADGLMRASSGTDHSSGAAIVAGKRCPFVGRISMDLVCIDVTDIPDRQVRRGEVATFIGIDITIDDVAAASGTIGYEILTRLGRRCHRVYRGAPHRRESGA